MIHITNASLSFGAQEVFDDITLSCARNHKIGLLGRNGSGKSTLLKAIAGLTDLDEGSIAIEKDRTLGYLPQEVVLTSTKSVYDELLMSSKAYQAFMYEKPRLEREMEQQKSDSDTNELHHDLIERYTELLSLYSAHNAAEAQSMAEKMLEGLGFSRDMVTQPVAELSVGWKMRLVLAKLLLLDADFYLFDEPTNHLDLPAKEWFFDFLKKGSFGFLLVTHDRHFLDNACSSIIALERGSATVFNGNYTQYIEAEKERRAHKESAYERQQKELTRKKATIERFRAKASKAKMAQSMIKQLDKIELIELEPLEPTLTVQFPPVSRSGSVALTLTNVGHAFEGTELFKGVTGSIKRGEKIGLIAPNGTGKTTLFNLITGTYPLQAGSKEFGHNVSTGVFEQDQLKALNPENTVLQEVLRLEKITEAVARSFLGAFLFSGDTVHKKIAVLSGGERNRVAMVKVLLLQTNLLLFDEPTNHLDLFAKEVLLQALQRYEGTMLFVSHDHAFLQGLATRIWHLTPTGIADYPGRYEDYLHDTRLSQESSDAPHKKTSSTKSVQNHREQQKDEDNQAHSLESRKRIAALEKNISRHEKQIADLHNSFYELQYGTPAYKQAADTLKQAQGQLAKLTEEWETLVAQ